MDLSNVARRLEPSVRVHGTFQLLRGRFRETYDTGLLKFPLTSEESARLDAAIRSAMHIYGNVREDSMSAENFAHAVLYIQEEMTAIRWIMNNPRFAQSVAQKEIQRQEQS